MLWRMSAESHLDRIGIMRARLDNLPQRHRSVTLHAAVPDVDFRTPMRWERIPGRHDPCSRNFPSHACHGKPLAIGISLAEIAGITRSWQRPARAGPRDWHNACGNCGNPRHGTPARYRDRFESRAERAERSETHSGPIAVRKYSSGCHWEEKWLDRRPARQLAGSLAGQWELADVVLWRPLTQGGRGEAPRAISKFPIVSMRESRKPRAMVLTYSGLLRPKVLIVMRKSVCSRLKFSLEGMRVSVVRSVALRDLRRGRLFRLGIGHDRRTLHLVEILPRQPLETRGVLAADCGAHGELLCQWIDLPAAAMELVVQVRPGRHAGRADKADDLALAHGDTGFDARSDPRHVRVGSGDVAGVLQLHVVAVAAVGSCHHDLAGPGRQDRRARRRCEVDAGVQRAEAQDRMLAHAEAGCDLRGIHRRAQEGTHHAL